MDPFKRLCQQYAVGTAHNLLRRGAKELTASRGESAYLTEFPKLFLAHVEEGLGTKNLVADAMRKLTGRSYYDQIAQCTVAMIVNDLITLGALPISIAMHIAAGESDWFSDLERADDLARGWALACELAGAAWGGGESPTLKGIIVPGTVELNGSGVGIIQPKSRLIDPINIHPGDKIILFASSGVHANGLTLCRQISDSLPDGYATLLSNGKTYGESLLTPTIIYSKAIQALQESDVEIHYAVNITGHGYRKLMRANQPFTYIVEKPPTPQPIFNFIQEHGNVSDEEAWGNFNMGAGFAIYINPNMAKYALEALADAGYDAWEAGHIEEGGKKVIIESKNIVFGGETLQVR
jgi:phosphoribosylformylglycinamidine cyclo-ligase